MNFYTAQTPADHQGYFHRQIGFSHTDQDAGHGIWESPQNGFIRSFGSLDTIQSGVANYSIPCDFLIEYQYSSKYFHFGIVFEGITYSMVEDKLVPVSIPSPFLTVRNTDGGINCWRQGQQFRGTEITIEWEYLEHTLLPVLGYNMNALAILEENVNYTNLSEEMRALILRMEEAVNHNYMTEPLQLSYCLEFLALLLHPHNKKRFLSMEEPFSRQIQLGKRHIQITGEDYKKIRTVHERILKDASSFLTIADFSQELHISEQKLKAGFQEIYHQTIWDFANSVRMNQAVSLLCNTDKSVSEISKEVGYQSQTAFNTMFKKWCGITPGQFRLQRPDRSIEL